MLALIDADFLLFYCTYQKQGTPELTPESVFNFADGFLWSILTETRSTKYIGFLTASPNFRKLKYPDYKANRAKRELPNFFHELRNHLMINWGFVFREQYEADDLVNIHKLKLLTSQNYNDIITISNDKDVLNLKGINYNPVKKQYNDVSENDEIYYFWKSMLTGDTADNIKGINGVGDKGAYRLLEGVDFTNLRSTVLEAYIRYKGEYKGILDFAKNYELLKILERPLENDTDFGYYEPKNIITNEL